MKITTTDGREYYTTENCPYCSPNTAGQHDIKCPNYQPPCQYYGDMVIKTVIKPDIRIFKYDDNGNFVKEI